MLKPCIGPAFLLLYMATFLLKKGELLPDANGQNESTQTIGTRDGNGVLYWVRITVSARWWLGGRLGGTRILKSSYTVFTRVGVKHLLT